MESFFSMTDTTITHDSTTTTVHDGTTLDATALDAVNNTVIHHPVLLGEELSTAHWKFLYIFFYDEIYQGLKKKIIYCPLKSM